MAGQSRGRKSALGVSTLCKQGAQPRPLPYSRCGWSELGRKHPPTIMRLKALQVMPVIILHYHEIWLKGCNRNFFVQKLKMAVREALEGLEAEKPVNEEHRIRIRVPSGDAAAEAIERLKKLPGIAYMALATETEPLLDAIIETGSKLMEGEDFRTYRVRARRSQKSIPFRSIEVERGLGLRIGRDAEAAGRQVKVDLKNAEATCYVEVTPLAGSALP